MAWGKKLLLSLSVFAIRLRKRLLLYSDQSALLGGAQGGAEHILRGAKYAKLCPPLDTPLYVCMYRAGFTSFRDIGKKKFWAPPYLLI